MCPLCSCVICHFLLSHSLKTFTLPPNLGPPLRALRDHPPPPKNSQAQSLTESSSMMMQLVRNCLTWGTYNPVSNMPLRHYICGMRRQTF